MCESLALLFKFCISCCKTSLRFIIARSSKQCKSIPARIGGRPLRAGRGRRKATVFENTWLVGYSTIRLVGTVPTNDMAMDHAMQPYVHLALEYKLWLTTLYTEQESHPALSPSSSSRIFAWPEPDLIPLGFSICRTTTHTPANTLPVITTFSS